MPLMNEIDILNQTIIDELDGMHETGQILTFVGRNMSVDDTTHALSVRLSFVDEILSVTDCLTIIDNPSRNLRSELVRGYIMADTNEHNKEIRDWIRTVHLLLSPK